MARKPAIEPARTRFATLLAQHLADGSRPDGRGEPWSYAAFAGQIQSSRDNDYVSARSVSNWCKSRALPVAVEPILRALFGADRNASADAREALREAFKAVRLAKQVEQTPPDPAGVAWVVEGDQIVMDRSVRPSDERAASDPLRQQLRAAIRSYASRLTECAKRLENTRDWGRMATSAAEFGAIVAGDVLARLGEAYVLLLQLGRYLETDARIQRNRACADNPLDAEVHGALTDLVRTAAPWLRGFPTVAAWDDEAGKALARSMDLVERARDFTRIAKDKEAITARDAREIELFGDTAHDEDFQGQKAGVRTVSDARNLLIALAEAYAVALAGPDPARRATLARRAKAVFLSAETSIEALTAGMPDDLRRACLTLISESTSETSTAVPVIKSALSTKAVPDDVEDQAREMILQGRAPPAEWRSHIRKLNFRGERSLSDVTPLERLSELQSLYLTGTRVSDVTPLKGLISLQYLYLTGTQVNDILPLANLASLRALRLDNTHLKDITPLAELITLERLYLTGTQVSEVTPLAGLYALQRLYLAGTQVSDITPLAPLKALETLDLNGTRVRDLAPLAKMSMLETLDLISTQVTDVTPLAGLSALQRLYLTDTQVSDVSPLAGLVELSSIDLKGTLVRTGDIPSRWRDRGVSVIEDPPAREV